MKPITNPMTPTFFLAFLEEVRKFFKTIDEKAVEKILYNIDLAERINDPRLFKKLNNNIWEFRTKYGNIQYRLLAFWDKSDKTKTLVIATHGIVKKAEKIEIREIKKAEQIRLHYLKV